MSAASKDTSPDTREPGLWRNPDAPLDARVRDLVSRLTMEEKVAQTLHSAPAIPRLGIPEYNWWNECLHGVSRAGASTVFPQAIGMAASFDPELMEQVATVISDEGRAKHHEAVRLGNRGMYQGLTFWSPNINIFRDPRWGRGQETYGECPYLTARMGVAFVRGLQGDDPTYLKTVATPKHFAAHSGPEMDRHRFNAVVSAKDLRETYLPAFRACVIEGGAFSVMGAYNRLNGEACCASPLLLEQILRREWGFRGYVVSDCGAIADIHQHHKITKTPAESAALAVRHGCDLCCGDTYPALLEALTLGLITEEEIDRSVERLFETRFRLGMFDPPGRVRWAGIPARVARAPEHRALARSMAQASITLLKNENNLLPLPEDVRSIAVIGPLADALRPLLGNYHGFSSQMTTPLQGIVGRASRGAKVTYAKGCDVCGTRPIEETFIGWALEDAKIIVAVMGFSPELEGEEGEVAASDGGGDRVDIRLPGRQEELLQRLCNTGLPVILVLMGGSPIAIPWAAEHIPAILMAWYPGEAGGEAIADLLFGDANPSGRLPVTFPRSLDQLPPFEDYSMANRTYRYMESEPLYPFGFGLSYTRFAYRALELGAARVEAGASLEARVTLENTGSRAGCEAVQLYLRDVEASVKVPRHRLVGVRRVFLRPGERANVSFALRPDELALVDEKGRRLVEPGAFTLFAGGSQPDARSLALGAPRPAQADFEVRGKTLELAP